MEHAQRVSTQLTLCAMHHFSADRHLRPLFISDALARGVELDAIKSAADLRLTTS